MAWIATFFGQILTRLVSIVAFISALAVAAFAALWLLGTDLASWVLDQALTVLETVLNTISFDFSTLNVTQYITILPAETRNMLGLIGAGQALTMIIGALAVRVLLQLIPFTRLGS